MKKIITFFVAAAIMLSSCMIVSAELTEIGYYVEHEGDTAIVYFETEKLSAFDIGIIYDPNEVNIDAIVFSDYYKQLKEDDAYTTIEVSNKEAVDVSGNTYVVITGAVMDNESGEPVESSYQEIVHVVLSGISEGDVIGLISGTAKVKDVKNANQLGVYDLYNQKELFDSGFFDGAASEPDVKKTAETENKEDGESWIYVLVIAAVVVVAAILIFVSKKSKEEDVIQETDDPAKDTDL